MTVVGFGRMIKTVVASPGFRVTQLAPVWETWL